MDKATHNDNAEKTAICRVKLRGNKKLSFLKISLTIDILLKRRYYFNGFDH
jgi:hypothetical protein